MSTSPPLETWLPVLLAVWRGAPGPTDGLSPAEAETVARAVKDLSGGLTGERGLAGQPYLSRPDLRGAYLLYYWPVSFAQTLVALRRAGLRRGVRALDLGSGPGPGAFALLEAGWTQVTAADRSPEALDLAARLAAARGLSLATARWDAGGPLPPGGPWDLIVLGHVLNEMHVREADRIERRAGFLASLAPHLAPGGRVLLLEPASHGPNGEALAVRDAVLRAGWSVWGPCFTQLPCPARAAGAACHDVLDWKVPHLVAQTARRAGIDKRQVPFTWLVVAPGPPPAPDPAVIRVVSEPLLNKAGRRRVVACGAQGRFSLSAPGAYRSPLWLGLGRGQALRVENPELREGGWGVGPQTRLSPAETGPVRLP